MDIALALDRKAVIRDLAQGLGFDRVAFSPVTAARENLGFFRDWCEAGFAGDMEWLARTWDERCRPESLLPTVGTVISLGVSYFDGDVPPPPSYPAGRVARYAWGRDYHEVIGLRLRQLEASLSTWGGPTLQTKTALDAQRLLERAFAQGGGLGFVGKNTNVIWPGQGSWLFLGEILINWRLEPDKPLPQGCGQCTACQTQCPTDALKVPFQLNARECVAYHTIENRGDIPEDFRPKMGSWLFGCDDCQEVCPYNQRSRKTQWPELTAASGAGAWVPLEEVLTLRTQGAFEARFHGTSLLRARRVGLLRNALIVAVNTGRVADLEKSIVNCLEQDAHPRVQQMARWALLSAAKP